MEQTAGFSHYIYGIVVGDDCLYDEDFVNKVLRRMSQVYCDPSQQLDKHRLEDRFIEFFEWNVAHDSVPYGTYEAFGHECDQCSLEAWECEALSLQDDICKHLHISRRQHKNKNHKATRPD